MARPGWASLTAEQQEDIRCRYKEVGPLALAQEFDIGVSSLRDAASKEGFAGARSGPRAKAIARIGPSAETLERCTAELFNLLLAQEEKWRESNDRILEKPLCFEDHKPIGIAYWGDLQIGATGVEYERMRRDVEVMAEADGLYVIGMGDYAQNPQRHRASGSMVYACHLPSPADQYRVFYDLAGRLRGKLVGLVSGNHDHWTDKEGNDHFSQLCLRLDTDNLWHGANVTVQFGSGAPQLIRARHSFKGESGLNTTNAQRRLYDSLGPCQVVALAHKHFNDLQEVKRGYSNVIYLRGGTYLRWCDHAQEVGGYVGEVGVPITVHYPSGEILGFNGAHFDKALEWLEYERSR